VFEDFRDDAVFQARLLDANAGTSQIAQAIGGGGYSIVQNNAQTGDATTITIATNDANSITEYLGMRIILPAVQAPDSTDTSQHIIMLLR
jgi:predicted AlkP superfamily phosphohydrolase/phosphomutase